MANPFAPRPVPKAALSPRRHPPEAMHIKTPPRGRAVESVRSFVVPAGAFRADG
jgi:hypothetical protein